MELVTYLLNYPKARTAMLTTLERLSPSYSSLRIRVKKMTAIMVMKTPMKRSTDLKRFANMLKIIPT